MTVAETLLIYAVIPLGIIALLVLLNMRGARRRPRYRPGQPWNHEPVWFAPRPERAAAAHGTGHGQLDVGHSGYAEIDRAGSGPVLGTDPSPTSSRPGGPLGGARGTW